MRLIDLLESIAGPVRWNGHSLVDSLDSNLSEFINNLGRLDGAEAGEPELLASAPRANDIKEHLVQALRAYLKGQPVHAYQRLSEGMGRLLPELGRATAVAGRELSRLFRLRASASSALLSREDLFHVPFGLRHLVATQRYSIPGHPCLYLGGSLYCCWEEMGRLPFGELFGARMECVREIQMLDLGVNPTHLIARLRDHPALLQEDADYRERVIAFLKLWPLIAACSVEVRRRGAPFVPEYVLPQLLLQWIRRGSSKYWGVRFASTRIHGPLRRNVAVCTNYAIPARTDENEGLCSELMSAFHVTKPENLAVIEHMHTGSRYRMNDGNAYMQEFPAYANTGICDLEAWLVDQPGELVVQANQALQTGRTSSGG